MKCFHATHTCFKFSRFEFWRQFKQLHVLRGTFIVSVFTERGNAAFTHEKKKMIVAQFELTI